MAHIVIEDGQTILRDDWGIEDVHSVAECMEVELTDEQAERVLHLAADAFDANTGINWNVMEHCVDICLNEEQE
jgi:hypothetical protein